MQREGFLQGMDAALNTQRPWERSGAHSLCVV